VSRLAEAYIIARFNHSISHMALGSFFYDNALAAWIFDKRSLKFIEVNSRCLALYGYSEAEFLHKLTVTDLVPPESREIITPYLRTVADLTATLIPQIKKNGSGFEGLVYLKSVEFYGRACAVVTIIDNSEVQVSQPISSLFLLNDKSSKQDQRSD
jgi:PAS domain S-box-containing protein